MSNKSLKVFVVGSGAKASSLPQKGRGDEEAAPMFDYQSVDVSELGRTLEDSKNGNPQLILLDSELPEADIAKTVTRIRQNGSGLPVLVLPREGASSAESLFGVPCLKSRRRTRGEKISMGQSLCDALLQRQVHVELSRMALSDELTGLYNRRGFLIHGSEYMKRANRLKNDLLVFYADLDNLKQINDQFGHQEGDWALVRVAEVFKRTFRDSDITARFGGDEFTALVVDDLKNGADAISRRLRRNMSDLAATEHRYRLSLSFGTAQYSSGSSMPLENLLGRADRSLYHQKRIHHRHANGNSVAMFPDRDKRREGNRRRSTRGGWTLAGNPLEILA